MCGLFGFKTHEEVILDAQQKQLRSQAVTLLALEMETRGPKASGVCGLSATAPTVFKKAENIRLFVKHHEYLDLTMNAHTLLGHTRFPTIGANTDENAHPYQKGKIIGAHNGHVSNYWQLDKSVEVDSEVIFKKLDEGQNNYPLVLKELAGAFALTWVDTRFPSSLYMVTHGNPLFFLVSPKLQTLFWASEEPALHTMQTILLGEEEQIWFPFEDTVMRTTGTLEQKMKKVSFKEFSYPKQPYTYEDQEPRWTPTATQKKKTPPSSLLPETTSPSLETSSIFSKRKDKYLEHCCLCQTKIFTSIERYFTDAENGDIFCITCGQEYNLACGLLEPKLTLMFPGKTVLA